MLRADLLPMAGLLGASAAERPALSIAIGGDMNGPYAAANVLARRDARSQ